MSGDRIPMVLDLPPSQKYQRYEGAWEQASLAQRDLIPFQTGVNDRQQFHNQGG